MTVKKTSLKPTAAIAVALVALAVSCSGEGSGSTANTEAPNLAETSAAEAGDPEAGSADGTAESEATSDDEGAAGAAASDSDGLIGEVPPAIVRLPGSVQIVPPDLSALSESGERLESQLGDIVGSTTGLDVVSATCAAQGGALVYQGSEENSFFDVGVDGSGVYRDLNGNNNLQIEIDSDGSGTYRDLGGGSDLEIQVESDGSGFYRDLSGSTNLEIEVAADGSGSYRDLSVNYDVEMVINQDGSGLFRDLTFSNDLLVEINADGTGSYRDLSGDRDIEIEVDGDGTGTYVDSLYGIEHAFTTENGILDPALVIAEPAPIFAIAERFPPLDSLGRLSPPCVTVVRLDADVLFDFDSDELRPAVQPILDRLAAALIETGQAMEIHGHTDSKGDEAYNEDLAARRAAAFQMALVERGVTADLQTASFGELRPVAPNEKADGSDSPAGRQLNRRIELVIPE